MSKTDGRYGSSKRLSNQTLGVIVALVVAAALGVGAVNGGDPAQDPAPTEHVAAQQQQAAQASFDFRNKNLRKEHFAKHGKAMGFADAAAYVAGANDVITDPESLHKTQEEDGDDVYYRRSTDEIVIVSTDGYLRTYFNPGGIDYYNRQ